MTASDWFSGYGMLCFIIALYLGRAMEMHAPGTEWRVWAISFGISVLFTSILWLGFVDVMNRHKDANRKACASGMSVLPLKTRLDSMFVLSSFRECDNYIAPWDKK